MSPEGRVVGLVTSCVLRDQFVDFLGTAIGCLPTINVRNGGALYQLTLKGSNAAVLASLLSTGSTFALPRKRAAACSHKQSCSAAGLRAATVTVDLRLLQGL